MDNSQNRTIIHKKAMLEALKLTLGVVTPACEQAGISRRTHYDWIEADPDYAKAVEDMPDIALDFAESRLHQNISNGSDACVIFYLKTKGKNRGYIERTEFDHKVTGPAFELIIPDGL